MVHHHGGACILPYFADGTICMVRQFRYAMQQQLWELPAGKLEKGEDPFAAAKRELEEECGLTADNYISAGRILPHRGLRYRGHLYLGRHRSARDQDAP